MTDQWLRSFIKCADEGSFTKAADKIYISTPALVQQINLMERELGFSVFYRSRKGIKLTSSGEKFYSVVKEILESYDYVVKEGRERENAYQSSLRIAYHPNQFPDKWLKIIAAYKKDSNVDIKMYPAHLTNQLQAIQRGLADMCIIAGPKEEYLQNCGHYKLFDDVLAFCMSEEHPLASKTCMHLEDLKDEIIHYGKYDYLKVGFDDILKGHCKELHTDFEAYDISTKLRSVSENMLFVIHYSWEDQYTDMLKVVKSDIPAGEVKVVYRLEKEKEVDELIDYMRKRQSFVM